MKSADRGLGEIRPTISQQTRDLIDQDLARAEDDLTSGRALGFPVVPITGVELDYDIEDQGAAADVRRMRSIVAAPGLIRKRRERLVRDTPQLIRQELSRLEPTNEDEARLQARWLDQAANLKPSELITYLAYRDLSTPSLRTPKYDLLASIMNKRDNPKDTVPYRFGTDIYQEGWYDNPGSPENRTNPHLPRRTLVRARRIERVFDKHANHYGYRSKIQGSHVTASFHRLEDGKLSLLHDLSTEEGRENSRRAVQGMLGSLAILTPTLGFVGHIMDTEGEPLLLGADSARVVPLRVKPDAFEWRYGRGVPDLGMRMLGMVAGFGAGMRGEDTKVVEASIQDRHWFVSAEGYEKERDIRILRAMQASEFDADGFAHVLPRALRGPRARDAIAAFCGVKEISRSRDSEKRLQDAVDLIATIYLDRTGKLTCDPARFEYWLKEQLLPAEAQDLLQRSGGKLSAEDITERLERIRHIDTQTIKVPESVAGVDSLSWHANVQALIDAPSALTGFSPKTEQRLHRELQYVPSHESLISEHFQDITAKLVSWETTFVSSLEGPSPAECEEKVTKILREVIPKLDTLAAEKDANLPSLYGELIEHYTRLVNEARALDLGSDFARYLQVRNSVHERIVSTLQERLSAAASMVQAAA